MKFTADKWARLASFAVRLFEIALVVLISVYVWVGMGGSEFTAEPLTYQPNPYRPNATVRAWHGFLSTIITGVLLPEAILAYRAPIVGSPTTAASSQRKRKLVKYWHTAIHTLTLLLGIPAIGSVHYFKKVNHTGGLYTGHAWMGVAVILLFLLNYFVAFMSFLVVREFLSDDARRKVALAHRVVGTCAFFGFVGVCLSGLQELQTISIIAGMDRTGVASVINSCMALCFYGLLGSLTTAYATSKIITPCQAIEPGSGHDDTVDQGITIDIGPSFSRSTSIRPEFGRSISIRDYNGGPVGLGRSTSIRDYSRPAGLMRSSSIANGQIGLQRTASIKEHGGGGAGAGLARSTSIRSPHYGAGGAVTMTSPAYAVVQMNKSPRYATGNRLDKSPHYSVHPPPGCVVLQIPPDTMLSPVTYRTSYAPKPGLRVIAGGEGGKPVLSRSLSQPLRPAMPARSPRIGGEIAWTPITFLPIKIEGGKSTPFSSCLPSPASLASPIRSPLRSPIRSPMRSPLRSPRNAPASSQQGNSRPTSPHHHHNHYHHDNDSSSDDDDGPHTLPPAASAPNGSDAL